jgi:AraC family ethanolamine operon transcriptional activator
LRASSALEILKFTDFDQFRHVTRQVKAESIPLRMASFAAAVASVRLPGCELHLQRTFPRIIDALLEGGALVIFPMDEVAPVKINGIDVDFPALAFGRGAAGYRATEWQARTYALLVFDQPLAERGWPEFDNALRVFHLQPAALAGLQARVRTIFDVASSFADQFAMPLVREDLEESLLEQLDHAFGVSAPLALPHGPLFKHQRIVETIDAQLQVNPSVPLYSDDLARQCGVSVRTLHNVTMKYRGVSLHQYLRMRRLWMVRQRLLSGDPFMQVKRCALAFGFWHLGEFSSAYATLFGEVPSRTLARGRERALSA